MSRTKTVVLWVLQVLLAALFVLSAIPKLMSNPEVVAMFRGWGFPENFYLLVGGVELLGAVGLLIPRVAGYAAAALVVIMIGASLTHATHDELPRVAFTGTVLLLLALVGYARRPGFLRPRP